jgi:hypothetical protein
MHLRRMLAILLVGYRSGGEGDALRLDSDDLAQANAIRSGDLELLANARAQDANKMICVLAGQKSLIA